jgi:integrase
MKPRAFEEITRHLRVHAKPLANQRLSEINRRTIAELLVEIETNSGPVARNRVRSSLSAFWNWTIREGLCEVNPVQGTGKASEQSRSRVLTKAELGKLWHSLRDGAFDDIVRLLILTGQRRAEIGGLRRDEIDLDNRRIVLPPARTKNKREHIVPLSAQALDIIRNHTDKGVHGNDHKSSHGNNHDGRVFPSLSWSDRKEVLDKRCGLAHFTLHDIRRTVASLIGELGFAVPHVTETILNHYSGFRARTAGVYQRQRYENECRTALERWADYVTTLGA